MTTYTITLARHTAQVVGLMGVLVLGTWDSYGTEQLLLRHGPEWDGLAIDATFHNVPNDEGVTVLADTDGLVTVPPEACMRASKYATITFRGVQDGVQRISCNLPYMVLDHAQVPGANSTATPSENAQALAQMQGLRDGAAASESAAKAAQTAAETAKANADTAASNATAKATAAAKSAADAKKTLESIPTDYSTLSGKVDKNTSGISELKEDLVAYKGTIFDTSIRELSSIVDNGVYGLNKTTIGFLDAPAGIDGSWTAATLVVEKCFNGRFVLQTFYDSASYNNPFYRLVTISTKTPYKPWERAYKADENYTPNYSASSVITKLSDFRSAGSVGIDQVLSKNLTDIPTYFRNSTFTLFNITKSFNSRFIIQIIFSTSKTICMRIINTLDGTTYRDWTKLYGDGVSNKNILTNKKWVACGDSFTEGVDGEKFADGVFVGKNKVYPFFIGERNNMVIVNEAVSGSSMTYISERHSSWENGCFSANRYKNIPSDADYITLYFGINDDNYSAPIGTIDDTKNTTFYGAWNIVLEHLITNHPFAKIGIIITNGSSKKYTDAERAICRKWGIPYLDMEADYQHVPLMQRVTERTEVCQKALELRKKAFAVSDSNTHPNAKAHEYESTFIENWLRTL